MTRLTGFAIAVGLCLATAGSAAAQNRLSFDEEVRRVTAAAPAVAPAKPAKPRKVLIYTACTGFAHDSIPIAAKAMEILGHKTLAYESVTSDDPANFDAEKLAAFDAVILALTTGEWLRGSDFKDLSAEQQAERVALEKQRQKNLLAFVSGGKGLVGIHAATDSYYERWPEFGEMIGGYFWGHPWRHVRNKVTIKIDEPNHPVAAAFKGQSFELSEEIFQFKDPYSRSKQRVLLSLDTAKSDMDVPRIRRTDNDFAVSWVKPYGKGRVFYCSLGHIHDVFWSPTILAHYLAGIQYALGDLKAEDAPVPAATMPATASAPAKPPVVDGYEVLFDGKALYGFVPQPNWKIQQDMLILEPTSQASLWTAKKYDDFVLDLEFAIQESDTSGLFIRAGDKDDPAQTAIEVQLCDSEGVSTPGKQDCGAINNVLAPSTNAVKPFGMWNHLVVTAKGPTITVQLNGQKVIEMDLDQYAEAGKNPDGSTNPYAKPLKDLPRSGYIGLQDERCYLWVRSMKIKPLEAEK